MQCHRPVDVVPGLAILSVVLCCFSVSGYRTHACYDAVDQLMQFWSGYQCGISYLAHFVVDVLPYLMCCIWNKDDVDCINFQTNMKHARINCKEYKPPAVGEYGKGLRI